MESIGVRELRQHASKYLERVAGGETIEVTDRGRPIAQLVPIPTDARSALIAAGRLKPATIKGNLLDVTPKDYGFSASAVLEAMRADER